MTSPNKIYLILLNLPLPFLIDHLLLPILGDSRCLREEDMSLPHDDFGHHYNEPVDDKLG